MGETHFAQRTATTTRTATPQEQHPQMPLTRRPLGMGEEQQQWHNKARNNNITLCYLAFSPSAALGLLM